MTVLNQLRDRLARVGRVVRPNRGVRANRGIRADQEAAAAEEAPDELQQLGPLVPVFHAVRRGDLPLAHALGKAEKLGAAGEVTPEQAATLSELAFDHGNDGHRRDAWLLLVLVFAAIKASWAARPERPVGAALVKAAGDLVSAAHPLLLEVADFRCWQTMDAAATQAVELCQQLGFPRTRGVLLQRRGSLVLDCYTAGRTPRLPIYNPELERWLETARFSDDPEMPRVGIGGAGDGAPPGWPTPLEALDLAERDLREALDLVEPARRGRVLKALTQVLEWRPTLGGQARPAKLADLCRQALAELDPDDAQGRDAVGQTVARLEGTAGDASALLHAIEDDWAGFRRRQSPLHTWELVGSVAAQLQEVEPARALDLLLRQRELLEVWDEEPRRIAHHVAALTLAVRTCAPEWTRAAWAGADDFHRVADRCLQLAARRCAGGQVDLADDALAAALLTVGRSCGRFDQESRGLEALGFLPDLLPASWERMAESILVLEATVVDGQGVNLERAGRAADAVPYYLRAAELNLQAGLTGRMVGSLHYVLHMFGSLGPEDEIGQVAAWLGRHALEVELASPGDGGHAVQQLVAAALRQSLRSGCTHAELQLLLGAGKGRRYAALLARGTHDWRLDDAEVADKLAEIRRLQRELDRREEWLTPPVWEVGIDEQDLVTTLVSPYEHSPAETQEDELTNRQRSAERRITALLSDSVRADQREPRLDHAECLDRRSALLQLFEGPAPDGGLAAYCYLVTATSAWLEVVPLAPESTTRSLERTGHALYQPPGGPFVADVRRAVQDEPSPGELTPEATELLTDVGLTYGEPLVRFGATLRAAGVDRLLLSPHRASHFLPFHLALVEQRPLADQFVVHQIPSLELLAAHRVAPLDPGTRRAPSAVFALGYAEVPQLPTAPSSASEGRAIATILGVEPALDARATESAFRSALQTCRYVHLRAHGRHNTSAPLFQTVFLSPDETDDGRLQAHELLQLDLRGLELVTLAACETALGRVDRSDNIYGIAYSLLAAGAHAVVATMWEVTEDSSETFFTSLYGELVSDGLDVSAAFRRAQQHTRGLHPEYRDWGAFTLVGGYRKGAS